MQIKKIHIDRFGKLRNQTFTFSQGLNVIYGPNEAGKSTLQNFLFSMFYGASASKKAQVEGVRKKYLPRGEEYTFGSMTLELDDKTFILERKIGAKRKDDFFRAYEGDSYTQTPLAETLGKDLFQLDHEGFLKTLCIGQSRTVFSPEKDEGLTTKLTNLLESGDEEVSYTKAMEKIREEMKLIQGVRKTGRLEEVHAQLAALHEELGESRNMERRKTELLQTEKELEESLGKLRHRRAELHQLKDKIQLYQVKDEFLRLKKNLDELHRLGEERQQDFHPLSTEKIAELDHLADDLEDLQEEMAEQKETLASLKREIQELDLLLDTQKGYSEVPRAEILALISLQSEELLLEEKLRYFGDSSPREERLLLRREELKAVLGRYERLLRKLKPKKTGLLLGMLLFLTGALYSFIVVKESLLAVLGVVLALVYGALYSALQKKMLRRNLKKADDMEVQVAALARELGMDPEEIVRSKKLIDAIPEDQEKERWETRLRELRGKKDRLFRLTGTGSVEELLQGEEGYRRTRDQKNEKLTLSASKREHLNHLEQAVAQKSNLLRQHLEKLGYDDESRDPVEDLLHYKGQAERMRDLQVKEEALRFSLAGIIGDRSEEEVKRELKLLEELGWDSPRDQRDLEQEERQLSEAEREILEQQHELRMELASFKFRDSLYVEDAILSLQAEEAELEDRLAILSLTMELMQESYDRLRQGYSASLNTKVTGIYEAITGMDRTVKVTDLFSMNFEEKGALWREDLLSTGALDQLYLSLRLAMAEQMFGEERVPLLFDEPFAGFDRMRLERTLDYLVELSSRFQIFLFTCHEREMELLGERAHVLHLEGPR